MEEPHDGDGQRGGETGNLGLPPGWSGYVGGMMTLVRVLPAAQYEKIVELKNSQENRAAMTRK